MALRQRATASRLIAAAILEVFAAIRRDAAPPLRIRWPGRPKTCIGGPPQAKVSTPSASETPEPFSRPASHICLDPVSRAVSRRCKQKARQECRASEKSADAASCQAAFEKLIALSKITFAGFVASAPTLLHVACTSLE